MAIGGRLTDYASNGIVQRFAGVVYVLHCFQKKSKRGIATPKADLDLVKQRLTMAAEDYRKRTKEKQ